jgi:uncharacterized membrane protein
MKLSSVQIEKLYHFLMFFSIFQNADWYRQYESISELSFKLPETYKASNLIALFWIAESKKEDKLLENFEGLYPYIINKHEKGLTMPEYRDVLEALRNE